ncbi:penicillin acylase family protein [Pseudomonas aeruginosa]|nr:penicillin acylase family protein [Pseudomonas aeruginosa]
MLASGWNQRNYDGFLRLILDGQADLRFWCGREQGCDLKLNQSLRSALDELRAAHGSAPDGWKWGEAHAALAEHVPSTRPAARAVRPEEQQGRRQLQRQRRALRLQRPGQPVQHTDRRDPADGHRPGGLRQLARYALSTRNPACRPTAPPTSTNSGARGACIRIADDAPDATDRQLVLRPPASSSGEPRP